MATWPYRRIVCLTEETTETLYLLGAQDRIVGISGYTVRPPQARRDKPRISAFASANVDKICALEPDVVLAFSDLQADIAADLARAGLAVHLFNQRSIAGILAMIRTLGAMLDLDERAVALERRLQDRLETIRAAAALLSRRPRVWFEEWDDPLISGIGWVSELITIAGGDDCFPELAGEAAARDRIVADPDEVVRRRPDIVIGSWCGKKFVPDRVASRPGWDSLAAVRDGEVHEIKSPLILQPGPAALTDGIDRLHEIIANWAKHSGSAIMD